MPPSPERRSFGPWRHLVMTGRTTSSTCTSMSCGRHWARSGPEPSPSEGGEHSPPRRGDVRGHAAGRSRAPQAVSRAQSCLALGALAVSGDRRYKGRPPGARPMSAAAESFQHIKPDDTLARRNAIVLAVAQALAGGNNTVIISTASIVGAVLAPDKGLATLPVTAMVFGMWL